MGRKSGSGRNRRLRKLGMVGLAMTAVDFAARKRGYQLGKNTVVRCRQGHLFTTIWIPGASLKAVRLGWWRLQRCPVAKHWTLVTPVRTIDLSAAERQQAREVRDVRIP